MLCRLFESFPSWFDRFLSSQKVSSGFRLALTTRRDGYTTVCFIRQLLSIWLSARHQHFSFLATRHSRVAPMARPQIVTLFNLRLAADDNDQSTTRQAQNRIPNACTCSKKSANCSLCRLSDSAPTRLLLMLALTAILRYRPSVTLLSAAHIHQLRPNRVLSSPIIRKSPYRTQ